MSARNAAEPMSAPMEITGFAKSGGPLTKRIFLDASGKVISDGSACVMTTGAATRVRLDGIEQLARLIGELEPNEAISLGALRPDLADQAHVTTKRKLNGTARPDLIARTGDYITYRREQAAVALLDYDTKGMPPDVAGRLQELGGFWPALLSVMPELASVARMARRSTSAGLYRTDTGEKLSGSSGQHVYLLVQDGTDIEHFLKVLHGRCWLAGFGWMMVGAGGQLLERSIVDRMVGAPERLVFEGAPIVEPPLAQNADSRRPIVRDGVALDTVNACPPLTIVEKSRLDGLRRKARDRLAGASAKARSEFIAQQAERLAKSTGISPRAAAKAIARQCAGVLLPDVVLPFDDDDLAGTTVAQVLANPERYEGATLADPLEGPEYGVCKANVMRRADDGSPWLHSFAHGRTVYELRYDARAVLAALERADAQDVPDEYVRLSLAADLDDDEREAVQDKASKLSGIGKRALKRKLKAAEQEHQDQRAEENRNRQAAERTDRRISLPAPEPDAERLPTMSSTDEVLLAIEAFEPPIRGAEGQAAEARCRAPVMLFEILSTESNNGESL